MEIANPIYDAVFKFLMEDKKSAVLIIGAITGYDIEDIQLRPTEVVVDENGLRQWTVYRLDLAVRVKTGEGSHLVLVEVQKAKFHTDIMRFRRYLGGQYSSADNYEEISVAEDQTGYGADTRSRALPIFTIYILGHRLEHNSDVPVIRVSREYIDNATGERLKERDEFIESLTHDSAIIQVPALRERRRDRLEKMLAIFDQALIRPDNHHLLRVNDDDYPEECRAVIRRLQQAVADNEVRQRMIVEDEIVSEFEMRDRKEQRLQKVAEEALRQKEEERRQKEEATAREAEERRQKEAALAQVEELKRLLAEK